MPITVSAVTTGIRENGVVDYRNSQTSLLSAVADYQVSLSAVLNDIGAADLTAKCTVT